MSAADIVQIIIGALSLVATVAVSFFIYWLQSRHEKEMAKIEEKQHQEKLTEDAHRFLIDNDEEIDYLPWCVFAVNQHRHKHHVRKIYTNFSRCSEELQNKILELAEFSIRTIPETDWVDDGLKKLEKDIDKYKLGEQPFLYDGAKYFHRSFERYKDYEYKGQYDRLFNTIYKQTPLLILKKEEIGKVSLSSYIQQYFDFILDPDKRLNGLEWEEPVPPVDYVWNGVGLSDIDEAFVCFWVMELVGNFIINIHNRFDAIDKENRLFSDSTDAQPETYEDRYYEILEWLYFTYCYKEDEEDNDKQNKKLKRAKNKKPKFKKIKTKKGKDKKKTEIGVDKS